MADCSFMGPPPCIHRPGRCPDPQIRAGAGPETSDCQLYSWGPPSAGGPQEPTKGLPLVGCLDGLRDHPDGVRPCSQVTRPCVSLEPRRRGDCFSRALAPRPVSCTPAGVQDTWYTGPHAAAWCTPGAWSPGYSRGIPGRHTPSVLQTS